MKKYLFLISIFLFLFLLGCKQQEKEKPLFELMQDTGVEFFNKVQDSDSINILNYRNFYNGGGVATGDINNDGLPDIYFTANQGRNKLFLNKGEFKFEDISVKAGFISKLQFSTGVVMADVNADGWLDIFVCNAGNMQNPALRSNQLFINNRDLTFTESAEKYGLRDSGYTTHASFFDYDKDGDLDCFKIDNSPVPVNSLGYPKQRDLFADNWKVPDYLKGGGDHLYRNDNGRFIEVTQSAGIHGTLMSFGLGVSVGDINDDYYPDIYVSNDFFERDYLYINQKNGTFKDELEERMGHNSYASMGADLGDINNDGYPEIFTTDMLPADDYRLKTTLSFDDIDQYRLRERNGFFNQFLQNTLQLNDGSGMFKDIANYSGVNASEWSWGALVFDADNDGLNDLYVCNGIYRDLTNQDFLSFDANEIKEKMTRTGQKNLSEMVDKIPSIAVPNKMYRNLGNLKFEDVGMRWGFTESSFSNGAAYADLDNDGDLEIVINNVNEPAFIFKNNSRESIKNNFIGIALKGLDKNPFAVGSKILVYKDSQVLTREIMPSRGFQSSVDYKQSIGVGNTTMVDSLIIIWPDLGVTKKIGPEVNKYIIYNQPVKGEKFNPPAHTTTSPLFELISTSFERHIDDDFTDFYREKAIHQMLSHESPRAGVADVNGDGLEDIYIGGTVAKAGQLHLQNKLGEFEKKDELAFKQFEGFVDGAVLFFDCDKDGDNDLLLCSAGNAAMPASRELQHRLYKNDGRGNFQISTTAFPANKDNISVAVANDFDKDGDLDLFVGARCVSGEYGLTPQSHIYVNDGNGNFKDMPADNCKGVVDAGMVTGAVWANLDDDDDKELIITGEWMAPQIFKYGNDKFTRLKTSLDDKMGWWQTITTADLDGDGREDLVMGNVGENFYLNPGKSDPVKLFLKDFDNNGQTDKIMSRTVNGKDKPVFMKSELESQLPVLKKQNLRNAVYAKKSVQELFGNDQSAEAAVKYVNYSASCVAYNKGNGNFILNKLPYAIQFSSVKTILPFDINGDGKIDLVIGGNEFGFHPQLGRLDASKGDVLIGDGRGGFNVLTRFQTGLSLNGQVRDIALVKRFDRPNLLFLQNNQFPELYEVKRKN